MLRATLDFGKVLVFDPEIERGVYATVWTTVHPDVSLFIPFIPTDPKAAQQRSIEKNGSSRDQNSFLIHLPSVQRCARSAAARKSLRCDAQELAGISYGVGNTLLKEQLLNSGTLDSAAAAATPVAISLCLYIRTIMSMVDPVAARSGDAPLASYYSELLQRSQKMGMGNAVELESQLRMAHVDIDWPTIVSMMQTPRTIEIPLVDDRVPNKSERSRGLLLIHFDRMATASVSPADVPVAMPRRAQGTKHLEAQFIQAFAECFADFKLPLRQVMENYKDADIRLRGYEATDEMGVTNIHPLLPTTDHVGDIHMPTVAMAQGCMPVGYYYTHCTDSTSIGALHEDYFMALLNLALSLRQVSADEFAEAIHRHLDSGAGETMAPFCAAMEIMVSFLTAPACSGKYRSDLRIIGKRRVVSVESVDCDGITGFSASWDCEDGARTTSEMVHILFTGRHDIGGTTSIVDELWQRLYPDRKFYGWQHLALQAVQRVLGHYTAMEILGSVTDAFPGVQHGEDVVVADMEGAQRGMNAAEGRKLNRYVYGSQSNVSAHSGAHQYGALIPIRQMLAMYDRGFAAEDRSKTIRVPVDQQSVDKLRELHRRVTTEGVPILPGLLLESTARTSPFLIGISHWCGPSAAGIDVAARKLALDLRRVQLSRDNIIQYVDTHAMRWVHGDWVNRRCSRFYRDVLSGNCRRLWELLGRTDAGVDTMSFTVCAANGGWGVPLEDLLRGGESVQLIPIFHRIPQKVRQEFHVAVHRHVLPYMPPPRLGKFSSVDKALQFPEAIDMNDLVHELVPHREVYSRLHTMDPDPGAAPPRAVPSSSTPPLVQRVFGTQVYFFPLRATLWEDWQRWKHWITTQGRQQWVAAWRQQILPQFGMTEIVIACK